MVKDGEAVHKPINDSDKILTFPYGIPGLEKYTTYVVYHKEENDISAFWLKSCGNPGITFTLVDSGQCGANSGLERDIFRFQVKTFRVEEKYR